MTATAKDEKVYPYPGIIIEDRNGERRMAVKATVTIQFETADGARLSQTYDGPELPTEREEEYSDEEAFEPVDTIMDFICESHEGRWHHGKSGFDAEWRDKD